MNARFFLELVSHGYFPKGMGKVRFKSRPSKFPLKPISLLDRGSLVSFNCFSNSSALPSEVSKNQAIISKKILLEKFSEAEWIETLESNSARKETIGSAIDLFAVFEKTRLGSNALGEKGKPAEKVGKEAAQKLLLELESENPVDSHCADQLLLFMALAKGKSEIAATKFTEHCKTNIAVIEQLLPVKFDVLGELNKPAIISVEGIGFK
jgi:RNA 3'-terminal phosphate cyclase (ATP)